jgi:hypothetical protein
MSSAASGRAIFSFICGVAVVTAIPIISLLLAPCGFPLSLAAGITAVVLGKRSLNEPGANEKSLKLAHSAVLCGWIGLGMNTLIMLIKLAMFVIIFILPAFAIWNGTHSK